MKLIPLDLANFLRQLLYNHKKVSGAVEHSITIVNSVNMSNCTKSLKLYQQKFGNVISYLSNWKFLGHYSKLPCYVSHSPFLTIQNRFHWCKLMLRFSYQKTFFQITVCKIISSSFLFSGIIENITYLTYYSASSRNPPSNECFLHMWIISK